MSSIFSIISNRSFSSGEKEENPVLEKTALHSFHMESLKGKMVPFAGYELPVFYQTPNGGVLKEHLHCRTKASVFDVSHMGQLRWTGKDRLSFIEKCVVGDIKGLKLGEAKLSLITNKNGGIIDDTIISNASEDYTFMVVNGATKFGDMEHFDEQLEDFDGDVQYEYLGEKQLLALQGPLAAEVLQRFVPHLDLSKMGFMYGIDTEIEGFQDVRITRCGYTGEDGFEIALWPDDCKAFALMLAGVDEVEFAGLGARDSLRLEAGLCLYGNDIDHTTTPTEAALGWTIGGPKARRRTEGGWIGYDKVCDANENGKYFPITRKRVGLSGFKSPARSHAEIYDEKGEKKIGEVTSGTFSPTLNKPIAMGYVEKDYSNNDTPVSILVRGKFQPAVISKMPFVPQHYYRPE